MKIKSLHLVGFKSFVDPTTISFDSPITCVVGPNGCGKSNVVDAIRWVMGEMSAKSLRGKLMEDVIFSGSESRQPQGMAEVSLTFSTEDGLIPADYANFSEITVTRRLFRSGESEYLINKTSCRLKDIIELFLGTGVGHKAYSVIEQGRIDFAINAKPDDRRVLIEEAAGISKFKHRKEAALRRMEGTRNNLTRLSDILKEIRRQINSLDRQVKKAEKFKGLRSELRELETNLATSKLQNFKREEGELFALLTDWEKRETEAGSKLATVEAKLETGRLSLAEKEQELSILQEKNYEMTNQIQLLEAKKGFRAKESESIKKQIEEWLAESDQSKERLATLQNEKEGSLKDVEWVSHEEAEMKLQLETAQEDFKKTSEEHSILQQQIEEEKNALTLSLRDMAMGESRREGLEARKIDLKGRLARTDAEIAEISHHCDVIQERKGEIQRIVENKRQEKLQLARQIEDIKQSLINEREVRELAEGELEQKREETVLRRSRFRSLKDLERNFEGYQQGVRSILRLKKTEGKMQGILGVVADYIEAPPKYEAAVGAALGEKLQSVIVKSHEEGVDAISYLKTQGEGRSTFIPMELRFQPDDPFPHKEEGVLGPLLDMIQLKGDFKKLGQYLFGDYVLVESLSRAISLWQQNGHKKTLVTLDGDVVDPHGVITGGRGGDRNRLLLEKKREMKELQVEIAELEGEIDWKEDIANQKAAKVSSLEIAFENSQRELHETALALGSLEKDQGHEEGESDRYLERKLALDGECRQLQDELESVEQEMTQGLSQKGTLTLTKNEKEEQISALQGKAKEIALTLEQQTIQLTNLKVQTAAVQEKIGRLREGLDRSESRHRELQESEDKRLTELTSANQKLVSLKTEEETETVMLAQSRKFLDEQKEKYEEKKTSFDRLSGEQREEELSIRGLRKEYDLSRSHTSDLKVTLTQIRSNREHLTSQMMEKYSLDLTKEPLPEIPDPFDATPVEEHVTELKERIEKMGDINLGSIPEYEELKTRNDFLTKQYDDLEQSLEALQKAISRINKTTKKRFEETLNMVNENFKVLFPKLFQGGRAELSLTDPNDLLTSGVDIVVQPPGKKLTHVSLLSGGEKALSATALVFSIFLVKPSPFCILDEVDAPLDDTNVGRFQDLIREMTQRTQFILISHNKQTMEMADTLYGITMQEPGVSKIVSVKLDR